jgi:tRNA A-37 threonylcarbamoyl transferase component Bud32/uncharacterized RDD family membrane protein YckC
MDVAPVVAAPLAPGTMLAHYRLGDPLGSGAMGTVYAAHDLGLDREVAVKVLRDEIASEPRMVERFFREARQAARVNHANLAHVYYVGSESGRPFFAMEHVPGEDLEHLVARQGPLALPEAVDVLLQAADGLAAAHAAGLVHRDVKPSNLIRRSDGVVKVTDFGLSRSISGDVDQSGIGAVTGTPTFMAPEQVRGEATDVRTDVYAFGLTAYTLLAGQPPFPGPTMGKVLSDQLNAPVPSLVALIPGLPPLVDEVLGHLCAKDPARRPATMREARTLLEGLRPRRIERAPLVARGAAYLIDRLLTFTVWAAIMFLLSWREGKPASQVERVVAYGAFTALWVFGQLVAEMTWGTSLGKRMLRLRVRREDGMPASRRALVVRFCLRSPEMLIGPATLFAFWTLDWMEGIATVAILAGFVVALFRGGRTLSDHVSGTTVIHHHAE